MKAALYEEGRVQIRDLPVPEPGPDEALVHITAAGVCHSDLSLAKGEWAAVGAVSLIGHEAIGVVESVGPQAAGASVRTPGRCSAPSPSTSPSGRQRS